MKQRNAAAALLVVVTVWTANASAQDVAWPPSRIQNEWVGNKLFFRGASGGLFDVFFKADGTIELAGNSFSDTGICRLTDSGYCDKWQKIRKGDEACHTVIERAGQVLVLDLNGSVAATVLRVTKQ